MCFTVKGRSLICSLSIVSLRLLATEAITVSSDQKKQNSPLPTAVAWCWLDCLADTKFGSDPHSDNVAVVLWLSAGAASCPRKGGSSGLMFFEMDGCKYSKLCQHRVKSLADMQW